MEHNAGRFRYAAVIIKAAFLCIAIIVGNPLMSKAEPAAPGADPKASKDVEARITDFHSKLKITPAQEDQWNKVAQVMRENATTMQGLIQERKEKEVTFNAVEDLKSHSKITDAHAAGLTKFIQAFEPLYTSMSDEQKKNADKLFMKRLQKKAKHK
jgi:protein CpxP